MFIKLKKSNIDISLSPFLNILFVSLAIKELLKIVKYSIPRSGR